MIEMSILSNTKINHGGNMGEFIDRIDSRLEKLFESMDIKGKKAKTADGAHRFDGGVDYDQIEHDEEFDHLSDEESV